MKVWSAPAGCMLAWCLFGVSGVVAAQAQPTLEPAAPQLGERARLHLVQAPADSTELPRAQQVLLRATADPRVFEVVVTRVGEARIFVPASSDTLVWTVHPQLAQASPDSLRPWLRVGALGPNWWPTVLAVLAILTPLLWWWLRHRRKEVAEAFVPTEAPHLIALRRLDEIEAQGLIAAGRFDQFYVEASHALRAYVGGRFGVPALDWTTSEIVGRLVDAGHERQALAPVDPLLRAADTVKFAAHRPLDHEAQRWLERAREWIEATAVEPIYSTAEAQAAAAQLRDPSARILGGQP